MIFVDTGAWFAAFVPNDPDHSAADQWIDRNTELLITTDYVVDELLTLMKIRGALQRALRLGECLLSQSIARIEWVTSADVHSAWDLFHTHRDKGWNFTDCVSRSVMERLAIQRAFAFDRHFQQFGTITVVP